MSRVAQLAIFDPCAGVVRENTAVVASWGGHYHIPQNHRIYIARWTVTWYPATNSNYEKELNVWTGATHSGSQICRSARTHLRLDPDDDFVVSDFACDISILVISHFLVLDVEHVPSCCELKRKRRYPADVVMRTIHFSSRRTNLRPEADIGERFGW